MEIYGDFQCPDTKACYWLHYEPRMESIRFSAHFPGSLRAHKGQVSRSCARTSIHSR